MGDRLGIPCVLSIFFKQKTAYDISLGLVGSEMCIRDRFKGVKSRVNSNLNALWN